MTKPLTEKYKIYREAARMIAEGEEKYSCYAIREAKAGKLFFGHVLDKGLYCVPEVKDYVRYFNHPLMPLKLMPLNAWECGNVLQRAIGAATGSFAGHESANHLRIMLLLMMAETVR